MTGPRDMVCISMSMQRSAGSAWGGTVLCSREAAHKIADVFRAECEATNTPYRITWSAMREPGEAPPA